MNLKMCECGATVPSYEGHICVTCRMRAAKVVATITVEKAFDFSRGQESASAYHTIRVEPGTYDVELRITGRGERYLAALFTGIVTASGYGSVRYENGQRDTISSRPYKYQLRAGSYWGKATVIDDAALDLAHGV